MADFVTVLTADASTSDEVISVASSDGARTTYPWRATIEDEVVYVRAGVVEGLDWLVSRGADDTDPVFHAAGAVLTAKRVGQFTTSELLTLDDFPAHVLLTDGHLDDRVTDEAEVTWLSSDPEGAGV